MPKDLGNGVKRYSRKEWGSRYGKGVASNATRNHLVAHTTVTTLLDPDEPVTNEMAVMRSMERYHAKQRGWSGIGYAEVVTDSGRVYEGRGPGRSLAHASGYNTSAYGFAHMGHGDQRRWLSGGWRAMKALVRWYMSHGWLTDSYKVDGHRSVTASGKTCPGTKVSDKDLHDQLSHVSQKDEKQEPGEPDYAVAVLADNDIDEGMARVLGKRYLWKFLRHPKDTDGVHIGTAVRVGAMASRDDGSWEKTHDISGSGREETAKKVLDRIRSGKGDSRSVD